MADAKTQADSFEWALVAHELKYDRKENTEKPLFVLNFGGGDFKYNHVAIHVVFDTDGNSVQVITSPIASVPIEKTSKMLLTLNDLNCKYRWVKLYLDSDNDLMADADQIIDEYTAGEACVEIVMRMANIIDEAYPEIMKCIWG